ncbi:hypothetical protein [Ferviditalea candida]|uniref:Cytochrome c oxidase subunit 2A n=1 Tax=Ferviditalea candida TaxID=3108399 RepID=A0ABU5ZPB8_9BACL|nr:cytochrome c oxidase subunit 2A [Paenibacillaceae bacterium T2]
MAGNESEIAEMKSTSIEMQRSRLSASSPETTDKEPVLTGTFASVMILGGFLLLSWVIVFIIFLVRNA